MSKQHASMKLEGIRKGHDLAVEKLKDDFLHQHKQSVARMKEKLAKKKANQLGAKGLTSEEEDHILENIQQEEQIQIAKLNQNYESSKNDKVQELLSQQSRIQQKLQSIIQENEALQLAADGHEAALLANQAIKSRSEQETRRRDLLRIHQDHTEAASREKDLLSARRAKGEGNLKNRLAEKRTKKERELKQKEEEALAALALKQKEEQEEREKLRQAKVFVLLFGTFANFVHACHTSDSFKYSNVFFNFLPTNACLDLCN
jgi:5-formaminoimidazole-4-carboxamide-1-beta-D-ribofuranosyl 5'-monophosphate synthetase